MLVKPKQLRRLKDNKLEAVLIIYPSFNSDGETVSYWHMDIEEDLNSYNKERKGVRAFSVLIPIPDSDKFPETFITPEIDIEETPQEIEVIREETVTLNLERGTD